LLKISCIETLFFRTFSSILRLTDFLMQSSGAVSGPAGFFIRKSQWDTTSVIEEAMLLEEVSSSQDRFSFGERSCSG
jgi:hypothetical protein